ncbi:DUF2214 family protein [Ottowia testudinis]|uniref:DUF2214 family protein n=1 Tax=Ottowia testudinis TaxID=2816950 RepID=A0A975CKG1_9BURK|nr:DUF2214 family protein [Ottowia testudinis]QTD45839.1 DUF2214 family protein [Ottowia testudinis]
MLEPWLAFFHISAFLGWIVFASAQAALCRTEWLNAAVVRRLARLDTILWVATAAVLLTGLARVYWGAKGPAWYWGNPLLHVKLTLFFVAALLQLGPTRQYRRWQAAVQAGGALPPEAQVRGARRLVMIATHLVALIPLAAVFMARGW